MTGYSGKAIRLLVLIMPKMSGCVKTFKFEGNGNKLTSFRIDDEKLLEKYKAIWTKIEHLNNITLNVPDVDIECEFFKSFLLILYLYTTTTITFKYI